MNKTIMIFLILVLLMTGCSSEPDYCQMTRQMTKIYLEEVAKPRGLRLTSYGGQMMRMVNRIFLGLESSSALNVDEARLLYVQMMEDYLQRVNCNEKLRPYLRHYPFEEEDIELMIGFVNEERRAIQDGHVALMCIAKDHLLFFAAYDPAKGGYYDIHEELYTDAYDIVTKRQNEMKCGE